MHKKTEHETRVQKRAARLLQKHRAHDEPYVQEFCGSTFEMLPGVFNPSYGEGAGLLVAFLGVQKGEHVLEVGTGSGAVAIIAAKEAERVVATDISPVAVECARRNVARMGLKDKVDVRQGEVFKPLRAEERFSLILFNPPFMCGKPSDWLEAAMYDEGHAALTCFLSELAHWLTEDGRALVVFSTAGDILHFGHEIERHGLHSRLLEEKFENEIAFLLYELRTARGAMGDEQYGEGEKETTDI